MISIAGIGRETLADIKRLYNSVEELESALELGNVPLRNDVVKKLKDILS